MKFETEYNIGDKIYVAKQSYSSKKKLCKVCNGNKSVIVNHVNYICSWCMGAGAKYVGVTKHKCVGPVVVKDIVIFQDTDGIKIRYTVKVTHGEIEEMYGYEGEVSNIKEEEDIIINTLNEKENKKGE
jgi:hypothetical protein